MFWDSDCEVIIRFGTKFELSVDLTVIESDIDFGQTYNHATSNLAIYSNETSQDKLPEA